MKTNVAFVGIVFAATLFASAIGVLGASAAKWEATSPDGVTLIIELKSTTIKVLDRVDATVTIRNGSDGLIAFAWDPLFIMLVTYEFNDVERNRKLEKTYWGEKIYRGADMSARVRPLQEGEKLVCRANWNIQYDFTDVEKVRGKALFKYDLSPRDSQKRFGEVEVDGIEFQFKDPDTPLFELIKAPPDHSRRRR